MHDSPQIHVSMTLKRRLPLWLSPRTRVKNLLSARAAVQLGSPHQLLLFVPAVSTYSSSVKCYSANAPNMAFLLLFTRNTSRYSFPVVKFLYELFHNQVFRCFSILRLQSKCHFYVWCGTEKIMTGILMFNVTRQLCLYEQRRRVGEGIILPT